MQPARHFAGRAISEESDSDEEVERPEAPVRRRPRFTARVIQEDKDDAKKAQSVANLPRPRQSSSGRFINLSQAEPKGIQENERISQITKEAGQRREEIPGKVFSGAKDHDSVSSESEESSEEDEEESEEEEEPEQPLFRPVFVKPKPKVEQLPDKREEERAEQRRIEARQLVSEAVRDEEKSEKEVELPDDTDCEEDREKDFTLWRLRELKRIMRDKQEMEQWHRRGETGASSEVVGDMGSIAT